MKKKFFKKNFFLEEKIEKNDIEMKKKNDEIFQKNHEIEKKIMKFHI